MVSLQLCNCDNIATETVTRVAMTVAYFYRLLFSRFTAQWSLSLMEALNMSGMLFTIQYVQTAGRRRMCTRICIRPAEGSVVLLT